MTDKLLGRDGCGSDEIVNDYLLCAGRLYLRSGWDGKVREVEVAGTLADLDRMTAISRQMAAICHAQGGHAGDYPDRVEATEATARAIREAFGIESPAAQ